jgi:positive regulator of sigma E activity
MRPIDVYISCRVVWKRRICCSKKVGPVGRRGRNIFPSNVRIEPGKRIEIDLENKIVLKILQ